MKVEKLKIGNTYYLSSCSRSSYKTVVLLKVIDSKHVLLVDKKNREFTTNVWKLHKSPDKAVDGRRKKEAAIHDMRKQEERKIQIEKESLVSKSVQRKIKELRKKAFATIENGEYVIKEYNELRFKTLEALVLWLDEELEQWKKFKNDILLKQYRFLKIGNGDDGYDYFYKLCFDFPYRELRCRKFNGKINEIVEDNVLDKKQIPYMNVVIRE